MPKDCDKLELSEFVLLAGRIQIKLEFARSANEETPKDCDKPELSEFVLRSRRIQITLEFARSANEEKPKDARPEGRGTVKTPKASLSRYSF